MPLTIEGRRALEDFWDFCVNYVGLGLYKRTHGPIVETIMACEFSESTPYAMIVVPRGTYKTSIARAWLVWRQLRQVHLFDNPYHRTIVTSATLALGKQILSGVETIMRSGGKNQRIVHNMGPLWADRTYNERGSRREEGLFIAPRIERGESPEVVEPNLWIGSINRISTGFHADDVLADDLNNKKNVQTDHQRALVHDYWSLVHPIVSERSFTGAQNKMLFTATPWHDDDVRGKILRSEAEAAAADPGRVSSWRLFWHSAYNEDGTAFFPEKLSLETLTKLRDDGKMGIREFSANYLCDPLGNKGFVDEALIRFKPRESFPGDLRHGRICVDPNQHTEAKELGCYAAIVAGAYDRFANLYVLEATGSREWGTKEFIDALFEVQEHFPNWPIYIENSHMDHFAHALRMEEAVRSDKAGHPVRLLVNWVPVDVKLGKYERWQRIEPRFRRNAIIFSDSIHPKLKAEIRDEFVRGPVARFKDFMDAVSMLETGVRPSIGKDGQPMERYQAPKPGPEADPLADLMWQLEN